MRARIQDEHSTNWLTISSRLSIVNHMVEFQDPQLDTVFHALGDRTRREMLQRLARGEQTVGQLAEPFSMSLAAASKHIKALEGAGLISREVLGRTHVCRLNASPLLAADQWLRHYEAFWTTRLDQLEALLRQDSAGGGRAKPKPATHSKPKRSTL